MPQAMSGLMANGQGILADPVYSGWRHINPYTAGTLVTANATGTGRGIDATLNGGGYGAGILSWTISGNPATATLLGSVDSATWSSISSVAGAAGTTGTSQLSGYYPYYAGQLDYVSAGARTAFVTMKIALR